MAWSNDPTIVRARTARPAASSPTVTFRRRNSSPCVIARRRAVNIRAWAERAALTITGPTAVVARSISGPSWSTVAWMPTRMSRSSASVIACAMGRSSWSAASEVTRWRSTMASARVRRACGEPESLGPATFG
jgi:hypothetical protein